MANEPGNQLPLEHTPPSTVTAAPSPAVPADYEELRQFRDTYAPILGTIAPMWDDLAPIIENEDEREYVRRARAARQRELDAQKPQLTPELKAVRDEFSEQLTPLVEYVRSERDSRQRQEQETQRRALLTNAEYATRLIAEKPWLAEDNYRRIAALAQWANGDGTSLEEAWKKYGSSFAAPEPRHEPPTSLSAASSAPGIPGESKPEKPRGKTGLKAEWARRIAAGMKG